MQVGEILKIHAANWIAGGNTDILGDSFLRRKNDIYRRVMTFAQEIGCSFVEAWPKYLLLPFHELPHILANKKVPYVPHGKLLQEIEDQRPGVFLAENLSIPESYHLHEAAHVIAEHLFAQVRSKTPEEKILKALMSESFANAVDALVTIPADTEIYFLFLAQNCYMHPSAEDLDLMGQIWAQLGPRSTFIFTFYAYLFSNFLKDDFSPQVLAEIRKQHLSKLKVTPEQESLLLGLGEMAAKLDLGFRIQTTGNFLKFEGHSQDIFEVLDFPFLSMMRSQAEFTEVVEKMADLLS